MGVTRWLLQLVMVAALAFCALELGISPAIWRAPTHQDLLRLITNQQRPLYVRKAVFGDVPWSHDALKALDRARETTLRNTAILYKTAEWDKYGNNSSLLKDYDKKMAMQGKTKLER